MSPVLAKRTEQLKPSATLAIAAKANALRATGEDIISLSVGEPDFNTPAFINEAAIKAIHEGKTRYTAVDGIPELKQAIQQKFQRENQLAYALDEIIASTGAKQSIFNFFLATLNPGDEVLIPAPYWVSYPDMAMLAEATPVIVQTQFEEDYKLRPEALARAITSKTKIVILNSPSNPTGSAYTRAELLALANVLLKHPHVLILSDDIYEHIYWGTEPFCNIVMACPELKERTLVLNGVSKAYAMTGWRLGYAAGPQKIIKVMKDLQSQSTSNPCSITQYATVAALNGDPTCIKAMCAEFKKRHDYLVTALNTIPGFAVRPCAGAFYVFPRVQEAIAQLPGIENDLEFAELLLNEAKIACVPGAEFGKPGYLRFSYALEMKSLEAVVVRLQAVMGKNR